MPGRTGRSRGGVRAVVAGNPVPRRRPGNGNPRPPGDVGEWLRDCRHDTYDGAPGDGSVWTAKGRCNDGVLRGASPYSGPQPVRPSRRSRFNPFRRNVDIGFRVARTLDP